MSEESIKVAYWYSDKSKNHVEEYRDVGRIQILSGALVIHDSADSPRLIVAPGDWHEVVLEDEES